MDEEIENLIKIWQEFVERQGDDTPDKFKLNPNKEVVESLAKGVLNNEKNHGLKYCPCRMTTGDNNEDIKLICPCNFKIQQTWREKGECWCSLFIKDE